MKKLPYIEDYIKLMGTADIFQWPPVPSIINLARYDVPICDSFAQQIVNGIGFTDKQAYLAHKLVIKYRKQFAAKGYDVTNHESNPCYKFPLRYIDRTKRIELLDRQIAIKFPFDQNIIAEIRSNVNTIPGSLYFDKERKFWVADAIEPRIIWAKEFGIKHDFEFTDAFNKCVETLLSLPEYKIVLTRTNNGFAVVNAAESLSNYLEENIGLDEQNFYHLVDRSAEFVYDLDNQIINELTDKVNQTILEFLTKKEIVYSYSPSDGINISTILDYAKLVNRFPIYIYESNSTFLLNSIINLLGEQSVTVLTNKKERADYAQTPIVHFNHYSQVPSSIPLLLSTTGLLMGHRRQHITEISGKIIFLSPNND